MNRWNIRCSVAVVLVCLMIPVKSRAVDAELKRAVDLAYSTQFDEAEAVLNGYIASHPGDPMGYMTRGTARDWKQTVDNLRGKLNDQILADYKTANDMAFQLWNKDQKNVDKMINLGNTYMYLAKKWLDLGKTSRSGLILKKAKKHMEEAIAQDPNRYDAYLAIGIFNFYTAHIPPGLQFIASLLGMSGDEALGLKYLEMAASNPNLLQADALFVLTHAYGKTKENYAMARTYLDKLQAMYPNNPEFPSLKGEYAFRGKQYEASRQEYQNLFSLCAARAGGCVQDYYFMANYILAAGYIKEQNYAGAKPYVDKAFELNVDQYRDRTVRLHVYRGLVLKAEGKTEEAYAEFVKVRDGKELNAKAWEEAKKAASEMGKSL